MKNDTKTYPVYFLYGPEDYLIEEEIQRLLDQRLSEKEKGFSVQIFNGEDDKIQEVVQTAETLPMFSRYRVLLVKEADRIDGKQLEPMLNYIQNPCPTTCLILYGLSLGPWKGHRAEIEKVGKVVEYPRLRGKALSSWIKHKMAEKDKTILDDGIDYLVETVGDTLRQLANTLEKISLSVGKKKMVELSDMEGAVSEVKVSTVFDLTDAIGRRDVEKALAILEKAMGSRAIFFRKDEEAPKAGDPVPLLLSMMARQYRLIWRVKEMVSQSYETADMARLLKISPWAVKNLVDQGKQFSGASLREGILKCHQADLALKRGKGSKDLLFEKLVIDLCCPGHGSNRNVKLKAPTQSASSGR